MVDAGKEVGAVVDGTQSNYGVVKLVAGKSISAKGRRRLACRTLALISQTQRHSSLGESPSFHFIQLQLQIPALKSTIQLLNSSITITTKHHETNNDIRFARRRSCRCQWACASKTSSDHLSQRYAAVYY